MATMLKIF